MTRHSTKEEAPPCKGQTLSFHQYNYKKLPVPRIGWVRKIVVVEQGGTLVESRPQFFVRGSLFMTTVRVKENEPFEVAMRRFKRSVEKTGLLTELRAREFYEKPTAERKRKLAAAVKRHYKRLRSQVLPPKLY